MWEFFFGIIGKISNWLEIEEHLSLYQQHLRRHLIIKAIKFKLKNHTVQKMNKLSSSPLTINKSYEKPELLKSYPDIDYEMIPIQDDNSFLVGQAKPFHIGQLSFIRIKNNLKTVKRFKLSTRASSEISSHFLNISQKKEIKCLAVYGKSNFIFLLPLEQMSSCKKTKKFTKIALSNGERLKTELSFKKLKKRLLKNGFIQINESHLVPLKK